MRRKIIFGLFLMLIVLCFFVNSNKTMTRRIVNNQVKLTGTIEEEVPDPSFRECLTELVRAGSGVRKNGSTGETTTVNYTQNGQTFESLTVESLSHLVGVYCENKAITNVKGIELMPNLVALDLTNNPNLKKLTLSNTTNPNVTQLWINGIGMSNFNENFVIDNTLAAKIKKFDIANNNVAIDMSSLATKFSGLTDLSVGGNKISGSVNVGSFGSLESLWINDTNISSVSSINNLKLLNVANTKITSLDLASNNKLVYLATSGSSIPNVDVSSANGLKYLYVNNSGLKTLSINDSADLLVLDVSGDTVITNNKLQLYVNKYTNLTTLNANDLGLTNLDLSNNTKLISVDLSHNKLTNLTLPSGDSIYSLNVSVNPDLNSLNLSTYSNLERLYVSNLTKLNSIDLSHNTNLKTLNAAFSGFSSNLNLSSNTNLETLYLDYEYVKKLNLSSLTKLKNIYVVKYNIVPVYGNSYVVEDAKKLYPSDITYSTMVYYDSFDFNNIYRNETITGDYGSSSALRTFSTNVKINNFDTTGRSLYYSDYDELRFMRITSDKYSINEEKGTIEVGADSDDEIRKNLKNSWEGAVFDISSNKLLIKYNDQVVKEFTLQRVSNPKTGGYFIYGIIFIMLVSFITFFSVQNNKLNNQV